MSAESHPTNPSVGELFTRITTRMTSLLRGEIELIKAQLKEKASRFATAIALLAVAGVLALYGLGWLFFAAYAGLAVAFAGWLAALILGVAILLIVGLLALMAKGQLAKGKAEEITAKTDLKLNVSAIKEGFQQ